MDCPEHILINTNYIMITMYGNHDIPKSCVPIAWWINPFRYSVIIRKPKFITINGGGLARVRVNNFIYKYIRPKLCKWLGIHQHMEFRGGEKYCHHCDLGKEQS